MGTHQPWSDDAIRFGLGDSEWDDGENTVPLSVRSLERPIAGVLFDMGGVLFDDTVWRRWMLRVLHQLGLQTNYHSFYRVWDRDFLPDVHCGRCQFGDALRAFMRSVGLSEPQIDELLAACQAQRRLLEAGVRPLPGVKSTLARLRNAGFVLGVLTDSENPVDVVVERLQRIGLDELFTAVLSSFDLQAVKPDPRCYQAALKGMGVAASQTAFVGHDTDELAGAGALGMATVAFNFGADARADRFIARFEQLLEVFPRPRPMSAAG